MYQMIYIKTFLILINFEKQGNLHGVFINIMMSFMYFPQNVDLLVNFYLNHIDFNIYFSLIY